MRTERETIPTHDSVLSPRYSLLSQPSKREALLIAPAQADTTSSAPACSCHRPIRARSGRDLIAARRLLDLARLGARPVAVAVAMPALDELDVDLFGAVEPFAVVAIVRERHEFFELLAEAQARRPFVEVEHVVDGLLGRDLD